MAAPRHVIFFWNSYASFSGVVQVICQFFMRASVGIGNSRTHFPEGIGNSLRTLIGTISRGLDRL
jgi:hypothetical protein